MRLPGQGVAPGGQEGRKELGPKEEVQELALLQGLNRSGDVGLEQSPGPSLYGHQ